MHDLDPAAQDEAGLSGAREGHLVELFERAGLDHVEQTTLAVRLRDRCAELLPPPSSHIDAVAWTALGRA
ncbi:MAG: hypothetical protein DLM59_01060 [Pseudonocardiales bacterium]|nr:MAG: hypothetical protein DLM59_01060 [Pseudonocardiales bacterium]